VREDESGDSEEGEMMLMMNCHVPRSVGKRVISDFQRGLGGCMSKSDHRWRACCDKVEL